MSVAEAEKKPFTYIFVVSCVLAVLCLCGVVILVAFDVHWIWIGVVSMFECAALASAFGSCLDRASFDDEEHTRTVFRSGVAVKVRECVIDA